MSSLRAWLRRSPQPSSLRFTNEDDEERTLKLAADARNKWKGAEEALNAARAVSVQCIDEEGNVLRAMRLDAAGEDGEILDAEDAAERRTEKAIGKERRELAALLDRYGDRLNEAFERGAQAANTSQEQLISIVQTLSEHLSAAITNLHKISVTYAMSMQGEPEKGSKNDELVAQVVGMAAAKFMQAPPPNGKGT